MTLYRKLGKSEQILANLNQQACTWNIVIVCRIKGVIKKNILSRAFDLVLHRHPILNCRIIGKPGNLYFEKIKKPFKVPIRFIKGYRGNLWDGIVQTELNTKINTDECLLHSIIIHPDGEQDVTYLINTLHHAVSDGQSAMQLHGELLTYYHQIELDLPTCLEHSLPPLSPVESFLPDWAKGFHGLLICQLFILRLLLQKTWHRPKTFNFETYQPIQSRHCEIIHRQLDAESTQALIDLCRIENTTVHAAICTAMILTLASQLNQGNSNYTKISCKSSVNLRKRFVPPINNDQMGAMASLILNFLAVGNDVSFWDLARAFKHKITTSLNLHDDFRMLLASRYFFHFLRYFPKEVASSVHVSNVGKVCIPQNYGSFKLEEISFSTANRFYGCTYTVEVTTFNEKVFLNFVFVEPLISRKTMEVLTNNTISRIVDICQTSQKNVEILPVA